MFKKHSRVKETSQCEIMQLELFVTHKNQSLYSNDCVVFFPLFK